MKKLLLALAAVATLGGSMASAESITIAAKGSYTVTIDYEDSNKNTHSHTIPAGGYHVINADLNGYNVQEFTYNILFSGNGDQTWRVPQKGEAPQILHFHGNLWNPWISN